MKLYISKIAYYLKTCKNSKNFGMKNEYFLFVFKTIFVYLRDYCSVISTEAKRKHSQQVNKSLNFKF